MRNKNLPIWLFAFLLVGFLFSMNSCKDTTTTPEETFQFVGTIVDDTDNPVPDVKIETYNEAGSIATDITDEQGAFTLENIPANFQDIDVSLVTQGFPKNVYKMKDILADSKYKDHKKLKILRNDTCKGLVTVITKDSASGQLLQNVEVKIRQNGELEAYGKTGENGKITFGNFCAGSFSIRLARDGYKVVESNFTLGENDTLDLTYLMQMYEQENCCSQVNVTVKKDGTDSVIVGATVKLVRVGGDSRTATTNEDGFVSFNEVCDGAYWLKIIKDGYQIKEYEGITFEGCDTANVTIMLKKEVECCGKFDITVKDSATGNALQGVSVKISKEGWAGATHTTGDLGKTDFGALCPGKYFVRIAKEGYKVIEDDFILTECDTISWNVNLVKNSQDTCCDNYLIVLVKNGEGQPIVGAKVKLWKGSELLTYKLTGDNGKAVFEGLCSGTYAVDIIKEGYTSKEYSFGELTCHQGKDATITLISNQPDCCGKFIVSVTDSSTGDALQGVQVKLTKEGWQGSIKTTGDNGKAEFGSLCPGKYFVRLAKEGYQVIEEDFTITECDTIIWNLNMVKNALDTCCNNSILTIVKDAEGNPIVGAKVKLWKGSDLITYKTTGEDGKVAFYELCYGNYSIAVIKEGYNAKEYSYGYLDCEDSKDATITLTQNELPCYTAIIKYKFVDYDTEAPIYNADITLKVGDDTIATGKTTDGGYYVEDGLTAPKTYTIIFSLEGYEAKTITLQMTTCKIYTETVKVKKN
ncbi:MAG: hypothetical protein A2X64_05670 [Ignavibacteria bacterium GWF2_33_9]|nr:MAG: hypothetical protein A2X64_05670 [Ignavibacteria bacterium GWF2_33_9]